MSNRVFPLTGACNFIGRSELLSKLKRNYTSQHPSHIQVVGPNYSGKSSLLKKLATDLQGLENLDSIMYWDLSGLIPEDDEHFLLEFCHQLGKAFQGVDESEAEYLLGINENAFDDLMELAENWEDEGKVLLAVLDGFEKPINSGNLSPNLWDRLRSIASHSSIRLLTGSRDSLQKTVRDPASQKSPFFNIFDPTFVRVGCFDEQDIDDAISKVTNISLDKGAKSELKAQTNGYPLLILETLNILATEHNSVNSSDVCTVSSKVYDNLYEKIQHLWNSFDSETQCIASSICRSDKPLQANKVANEIRDQLIDSGFVQLYQNKLQNPARILSRFIDAVVADSGSMNALLGNNDSFAENFKNVLELRLASMTDLPQSRYARKLIKKSLDDLPEYPIDCIKNIRGIIDAVLELVWATELESGNIPQEWFNIWERNDEKVWGEIKNSQFMGNRGAEMQVLNLMTGTIKTKKALADKITKRTVVLISGLHDIANFGQHRNGTPVNLEFAYLAMFNCIEMLNSLILDLTEIDSDI